MRENERMSYQCTSSTAVLDTFSTIEKLTSSGADVVNCANARM